MKIKEWLHTFLKHEPFNDAVVDRKGREHRGMAADIPKKYAFQDAILDKRRGMKIEEWLQTSLKVSLLECSY